MKRTNENKKKKFKLFDMNRDGKGVYETESRKPNLIFFFKLFFRKFTQLLQLNLLMLLMVIPILVVLFIFLLGEKTPTATSAIYAPLYGINALIDAPSAAAMLDLSFIQMGLPVFSPAINFTIIAMVIVLAATWGWQNVGSAYVLRGLFRGDPVFVFSDYIYGIKKNFWQAFFLGLIDFICTGVLVVDFLYFYNLTGSFGFDFMYIAILALSIIWLMMRFYIYNLLVTFNLKNLKILKNALIFSILGIARNIVALIGIALLLAVHIFLIVLLLPYGISIPLVLPFVYVIATIGFIATFAAFPVIEKYMITPALVNESSEEIDELAAETEASEEDQ